MSLINQMLKDLDARQPIKAANVDALNAVSEQKKPTDWLRLGVWAFTVSMVLAYVVYSWWFEQQPELSESVVTVMPENVKKNPVQPDNTMSAKAPAVADRMIASRADENKATSSTKQQPVISQAAPKKEPAYLPLKLDDPIAKPKPKPEPVKQASAATKPQRSNVSNTTALIDVKPAAKSSLQQSRELIADGRLTEAEKLLREQLKQNPGDAQQREILIGLMLRNQRYAEASKLLQTGLRFYPYRESFAVFRADEFLRDNDQQGAIAILQKQLQSRYAGDKSRAMLAPLFQQAGRYAEARVLYEQLLSRDPDNGRYWMGLATSLDADSMFEQAATAYTNALQKAGMSTDLRAYAQQRLQQINAAGQQ